MARIPHQVLVAVAALAGTFLPAGSARAEAPPDSTASYWGPLPAPADSVTSRFENRPRAGWEYPLLVPIYVVRLPVKLVVRGLQAGVEQLEQPGRLPQPLRYLAAPYAGSLDFRWSGSVSSTDGFVLGLRGSIGPPDSSRVKVGLKVTTEHAFKATLGWRSEARTGPPLEAGVGIRRRRNNRFFGIGPFAREEDQSFFERTASWVGTSMRPRVAGEIRAEGIVVWSAVDSREARGRIPDLTQKFAGDLPPGFGDRSTGMEYGLGLSQDTTQDDRRPQGGGIRRLRLTRFDDTDAGARVSFWHARGELQQFVNLGRYGHDLALRAYAAWLENVGRDDLPFSRLLTNDDSNVFRGYYDDRWRDRGLTAVSIEYRWPGWAQKTAASTGCDWYAFGDFGQVFGRTEEIGLANVTKSWGFGARIAPERGYWGRVEFAWSEEGFQFRLQTDQIFQYSEGGLYHGRNLAPLR